jgi:hypothetical protein
LSLVEPWAAQRLTTLEAGLGTPVQAYLTPLTAVQQRILELRDLTPKIYLRLAQHCSEPVLNLSEP